MKPSLTLALLYLYCAQLTKKRMKLLISELTFVYAIQQTDSESKLKIPSVN
jgi:hypothetical protein